MTLKVYVDRLSQPSRAVVLFCKINGIDFEEIRIDIVKNKHLTPEFNEINPMYQLPAIVDGRFKLFERYLGDVSKRAKIHSVLDWHHSNLRRGSVGLVFSTIVGPLRGLPPNFEAAKEGEKLLSEKDHDRILSPYKRVGQWIEDTKSATAPYFEEVHRVLFKVKKRARELMGTQNGKIELKAKL